MLFAADDVIWNAIIVAIATIVVSIIQTVGMVLSKRRDDRNQAATKDAAQVVAEKVETAAQTVAARVETVKSTLAESTVKSERKLEEIGRVVDDVAVNAEATLKMQRREPDSKG